MPLLELTNSGLYCAEGDFFVDPWRGVNRAIITHAHSDHARWGSKSYLCSTPGEHVLRTRLGDVAIESMPYGVRRTINGITVSLHPAGHLLGSAQVRIESPRGEIWVVSGDYKTQPDVTCAPFEPVRCHTFITESTFGLPIYRWRSEKELFHGINEWWRANQARGWTSIIFAYALGKAQRILGGIDPTIGPILLHGTIPKLNEAYRKGGITLPEAHYANWELSKQHQGRALVIAPPSAAGSPWTRKFGDQSVATASGWMQIRGTRRRGAMDRGFVLSDHADWDGLHSAIAATGAERIGVTHGYTAVMTKWLREKGLDAFPIETRFEGERAESEPESAAEIAENNAATPSSESVPLP